MNDCWQVLDLPSTTDVAAVKRAYRALIKRYHPDTIASGPPEMIRRYTVKCGQINQAFRQALEQCTAGPHANAATEVDREEAGARPSWGGTAERASGWRPPKYPATGRPLRAGVRNGGPASMAVDYLASLLVIGSPFLILCFGNMVWQMVCLFGSR